MHNSSCQDSQNKRYRGRDRENSEVTERTKVIDHIMNQAVTE